MNGHPLKSMENENTKTIDARAGGPSQASQVDRVDKIRDLLFGEQMVGYERQFAELERALTEKIDRLNDAVQEKLDALDDATVKREKLAQELESLARTLRQGIGTAND